MPNQIVVDLGNASHVSIPQLCHDLGARAYIGVDLHNVGWPAEEHDPKRNIVPPNDKWVSKAYGNMPYVQIRADMFDFLRYVPDNSICISINGIDSCTLDSDAFKPLLKEIERVCIPNGIIFGNGTQFLSELKSNPNFIDLFPRANEHVGTEMYKKKPSTPGTYTINKRIAATQKLIKRTGTTET